MFVGGAGAAAGSSLDSATEGGLTGVALVNDMSNAAFIESAKHFHAPEQKEMVRYFVNSSSVDVAKLAYLIA